MGYTRQGWCCPAPRGYRGRGWGAMWRRGRGVPRGLSRPADRHAAPRRGNPAAEPVRYRLHGARAPGPVCARGPGTPGTRLGHPHVTACPRPCPVSPRGAQRGGCGHRPQIPQPGPWAAPDGSGLRVVAAPVLSRAHSRGPHARGTKRSLGPCTAVGCRSGAGPCPQPRGRAGLPGQGCAAPAAPRIRAGRNGGLRFPSLPGWSLVPLAPSEHDVGAGYQSAFALH